MIKNIVFSFLTIFSFYIHGQNVLASYGFGNITTSSGTIDPTPVPLVSGLTFSPFTASGVSANPNATGRFTFTGWPSGATNAVDSYSSFTGVLTPTAYYEVSLTPNATYTLNLSAISFFVRRSATGIRNYAVRSSADNFATNLPASVGTNTKLSVINPDIFFWNFDAASTSSDQKGSNIALSSPSFTSCTSPLTFRFYGWNSEGSGGTFSIDSVVFFGSATNVFTPPPPIDVGISSLSPENVDELVIYPNPVRDGFIFIELKKKITKIELTDLFGNVLLSESVSINESKIMLNASFIQRGAYFLRFHSENTSIMRKIIFSH